MGPADQMGMVTLSTQEPMAGTAITATLVDADGMVTGQVWQWQKSTNKTSWMAATGSGAMTRTYTPVEADDGYYLRATVTYTDAIGPDRMAYSEATTGTVTVTAANPLLVKYDTNPMNGLIDREEALDALDSYLAGGPGAPLRDDVLDVLDLYLARSS